MGGMTILDASKQLQLSKNTVKYRLKKAPPDATYKGSDGLIYVTESGLVWLEETKTSDKPVRTTNKPEKTTLKPEQSGLESLEEPVLNHSEPHINHQEPVEEPVQPAPDPALLAAIEALKQQLDAKDKQIDQLTGALLAAQNQAVALTSALESAQEQARAAQALHAGTLQQSLIESGNKETAPEKRHKGFWQRLFGHD